MSTDVAGTCPACGSQSLFLGSGGHVTCRIDKCPNPCAADEILADREIEHIVVLHHDPDEGFTIRHPLRERIADALLDCDLHSFLSQREGPPARPGRYRVYRVPTGSGWSWEVLS